MGPVAAIVYRAADGKLSIEFQDAIPNLSTHARLDKLDNDIYENCGWVCCIISSSNRIF